MDQRLGTSSSRPRTAAPPGTQQSAYAASYTIPRTANSEDYFDPQAYTPHHLRQYQDDLYEEEEEEEQEDDEDVFAYLPPTTADQIQVQQEALAREQQQPQQRRAGASRPRDATPPQSPIDPGLDFLVDPHSSARSPTRRDPQDENSPRASSVFPLSPDPASTFPLPPDSHRNFYNHPPQTALSAGSSTPSHTSSFDGVHGPDAYKMRSLNSAMNSPPPALTNPSSSGAIPIPVSRIRPGAPNPGGGIVGPTAVASGTTGGGSGGYLTQTLQTFPSIKEVRVTFPTRAPSESPEDKSPLGGAEGIAGPTRQDNATSIPHHHGGYNSLSSKDIDLNDSRSTTGSTRRRRQNSRGGGPARKMTFDSLGVSELSGLPGEEYFGDDINLVGATHMKTAASSFVDTEQQSSLHHRHHNGPVVGYSSYLDNGLGMAGEEEEDSPYPEVRASVSNLDDPEMPVLTIRMWILGLTLCIIASGANTFFNFRYPGPTIGSMVLLLIAHPCGKFLAYSMPINTYTVRFPMWMSKVVFWREDRSLPLEYEINLNPGPFNIKEHALIFIMTNVSVYPAYALNAIVVADVYYGIRRGLGFNFLLVLGNQVAGFGLAGLCRRFLVWPASLIWPQDLVVCALLNTLHAEDDEDEGISRFKFFSYVGIAAFFFYFLPGFLFQALSIFSWVCWIRPNNIPINQLFGVSSGLGMGIVTFDWTEISFIGSPLMVPWWAEVHIMVGFVLIYWIIGPILYYTDFWHFAHLPILGYTSYDRYAEPYNVSRVLYPDHTLNIQAYNDYSPLYLTLSYAATYFLSFVLCTCMLVHTVLYHGPALMKGLKRAKMEDEDIHSKLMRYYPEVPDWWYAAVFCLFFVMGFLAILLYHTGVPIWSLFFAMVLPLLYVLPSGFIYAYSGQSISFNVVAEALAGVLFRGKPFTNMIFKAYSVETHEVAINFVQDLKLGHYIKVPPRATYIAQVVSTVITAFVQVLVQRWLFNHTSDICMPGQREHLTCPTTVLYYNASVIWGVIGPTRQFGPGTLYKPELWAILFGVLVPIPFWLWQRQFPNTRLKTVNIPLLLNGANTIPPALGINFSSWFVVAFIFQYLVRRRNFRWWSKYNYILSAALDSGTLTSVLFIFFTLQFPKNGNIQVNWWGNQVFVNTVDGQGPTPFLSTGPEGFA